MKNSAKICAAGLAVLLTMTGCSNNEYGVFSSSSDEILSNNSPSVTKDNLTGYGASVTVADIKKAFNYDDSKDIMPLYNVEQTESFDFTFPFSAYDANIDLYDFVSVHTDAACKEESSIYYTAKLKVENGKSTLTVSPMSPVLATDTQSKEQIYDDICKWGNAPIYYMALHYDLESTTPVKLDNPVIIPFTVKSEANAPTVKGVVSNDGRFSLEWEPVEGAEKYIIYKLMHSGMNTGVDNHDINGAETGYDCGINSTVENQLYLLSDGETTECTFDGFAGPVSHSMVEITDMLTGKVSNFGQNYSVFGEYFVTAVVNGKESGLSNPVATSDLSIPFHVTEESEIQGRYPTPADFPAEVDVLNIDGSITRRKVTYERTHVDCYEYSWDEYDYVIEGTSMHGNVGFDEDKGEPPQASGSSAETGNTAPEDNIEKIPDSSLETIIPAEDGNSYEDVPLIDAQTDNTRNHIANGNRSQVDNVPDGVYINADSAEEEWLALNLVQGNTEISVEGFTSLQNPYTLADVFYKVYYQNPYVIGVSSFSYDYENQVFIVEYAYDNNSIKDKQSAISKKASEIIGNTVTADMDISAKTDAIYNYLVNNAVYDNEALEDAEKNNFKKTRNSEFEDSFNTYGVLVKGKGVCMSYAYAFKLLCDMSDIECAVVTGYLDGSLPHAWNMVKINGEWYEIDCTNNAVNTGIPYYLYQSDSAFAEKSGYTKDEMFALDWDIESFNGDDNSLEYYRKNNLFPENLEEYKQLIVNNVNDSTKLFAVRYDNEVDAKQFGDAVILAFNELGIEDKLKTLRYSTSGGFLVLIIE